MFKPWGAPIKLLENLSSIFARNLVFISPIFNAVKQKLWIACFLGSIKQIVMMDEFITKRSNSSAWVEVKRVFSGYIIKPNEKRFLIISFMLLIQMFCLQAMVIKS